MKIEQPKLVHPMPDHAKRVFKGIIFDVYQWEQELYDGTTAIWEKLKRPDASVVFGVLPDGKIILARQEQPGIELQMGAIAGRAEPDESALETAKREFLEESGYEADQWFMWDATHPSEKIEWTITTFIAKGLRKVAEQKLDAGERIEIQMVTFDELVEMGSVGALRERYLRVKFMEAKYDKAKREELRELFDPNV